MAKLPGVLQAGVHDQLYEQSVILAETARIQRPYIWRSVETTCAPLEIQWLRKFHTHAEKGKTGLAYIGANWKPLPTQRMQALAGALIRNFVDARVWTVQDVIDEAKEGELPLFSCLLIQNFFVPKLQGGEIARWHLSQLMRVLLSRHNQGLQTVVWIRNWELFKSQYGVSIYEHIDEHFLKLKGV